MSEAIKIVINSYKIVGRVIMAVENIDGMLGSLSANDNVKFDFFKLNGLTMVHRQIEHRNGLVFMRSKKRPVVMVERKE